MKDNKKEDIIVRHEAMGPIIWSKKYKSYYFPIDRASELAIAEVLNGKKTNGEVFNELQKLGLGGKRRDIISKNPDGLMAPLEYYFDYTTACNLRCKHCYNRNILNSDTMSEDNIKKVLDDMYNNGVMRVHLAGGEPTLFHKKLDTYLGRAQENGIVASMASNGIGINDELCEILDKNGLLSITISIEFANELKNASIRGAGTLAKSIEGIKKLVDYKEKHNAKYFIGLKTSYDSDITKEDAEDLIKMANDLKISILKFNPERCMFHEPQHYSKIADKYCANLEMIKEAAAKYKGPTIIGQVNSPINGCGNIGLPNMKGCVGGQELIAVSPNGLISPCLMSTFVNLGNIVDYDSIVDVYKSEGLKKYLKQSQDYECGDCENHPQCRGGCQIRKKVEFGEITGTDPLCPHKLGIKTEKKKMVLEEFNHLRKIVVAHSL